MEKQGTKRSLGQAYENANENNDSNHNKNENSSLKIPSPNGKKHKIDTMMNGSFSIFKVLYFILLFFFNIFICFVTSLSLKAKPRKRVVPDDPKEKAEYFINKAMKDDDGKWYNYNVLSVSQDGHTHCDECFLLGRVSLWGVTKAGTKDRGAFIHDKRTPTNHLGSLTHNPGIVGWKVCICVLSILFYVFLLFYTLCLHLFLIQYFIAGNGC